MNLDFFREKINQVFPTIEEFASQIGVTRASVSAWLNGRSTPEDSRLLDIADALQLSEREVDSLLGIPETSIVFRKVGGTASEDDIKRKSQDIADTFFKIDGSSYVLTGSFVAIANNNDPLSIANYIRKNLLSLTDSEPVKLGDILMELKKHNIGVFFMPFNKIGLVFPNTNTNREVAFTAQKGERVIIFADTNRKIDEINFDLCHELAHVVLNHSVTNDEQERLCNKVAQELVYPKAFLEHKKNALAPFLDASKFSWYATREKFLELRREFDWCPKGLALSLRDNGLIKPNKHEFFRLMKLQANFDDQNKSVGDIYFRNFNTEDFESLELFFNEEILKNKDIFKPFIELKDASTCGRLSPRKLAEVLQIDSGDADELVRSWISEQEIHEDQDDNESNDK